MKSINILGLWDFEIDNPRDWMILALLILFILNSTGIINLDKGIF